MNAPSTGARRWIAGVLAASLLAPASLALASPVTTHPVKLALVGGFELFAGFLAKGKATDKDLVNLAQGRSVEMKPPKNEILALRIDCATGDSTLVVWDTTTDMQIVAVSSTFSMSDDIAIQNKGADPAQAFSVGQFDWQALGNATDGITGGTMAVAAVIKYGDVMGSVCPTVVKATVIGTADIVADGLTIDLLVIKGKAAAKSPVHVVP